MSSYKNASVPASNKSKGVTRILSENGAQTYVHFSFLLALFKEVASLGSSKWKKLVEYLMSDLPDNCVQEEMQFLNTHFKDAKLKLETFLGHWYDHFSSSHQREDIDSFLQKTLQDVLHKPKLVLAACKKEKSTEGKPNEYNFYCEYTIIIHFH